MVKQIADAKGHKIIMIPGVSWLVKLMMKVPGKIGRLATKAFGDWMYEMRVSKYIEVYQIVSLESSIDVMESREKIYEKSFDFSVSGIDD